MQGGPMEWELRCDQSSIRICQLRDVRLRKSLRVFTPVGVSHCSSLEMVTDNFDGRRASVYSSFNSESWGSDARFVSGLTAVCDLLVKRRREGSLLVAGRSTPSAAARARLVSNDISPTIVLLAQGDLVELDDERGVVGSMNESLWYGNIECCGVSMNVSWLILLLERFDRLNVEEVGDIIFSRSNDAWNRLTRSSESDS